MLILPQQKLGFMVLQEIGSFRGQSIGGGWLAMPVPAPDINDHEAWSQYISKHTPVSGLFAPLGGTVIPLPEAISVRSAFLMLHPLLKAHSPVPTLRVRLLNWLGESCLSIILNDEVIQVPSTLN